MTGNKKADDEFFAKLLSERPEISEIMGLNDDGDPHKKWYRCPHCGKALFPLREDTRIQNLIYRCKACKHDIEVNI